MFKKMGSLMVFFLPVVLIIGFIFTSFATKKETETTWKKYDTPEEAGWSADKLREARQYYNSLNSTAAIGIYKGKVLFEWGDVSQNTNAHSVRKSLLSALFGIHEEEGTVNLDETLDELNIDDDAQLSDVERQATIEDLLTSRSGVFLPAGEESRDMINRRPPRESHQSGTYFYYNNWDFNTLGTIFNRQTDSDIFEEFKEKIAIPLGMEDFNLNNTMYRMEAGRSSHPSYLFSMSARDMARFGQLYLQNGKWEGEQIIPEHWIERSTLPHAETNNTVYDYGYLWWVASDNPLGDSGLFSAVGRHGQSIDVIREKDFVFVHRVDSSKTSVRFLYQGVNQRQRLRLLELILDSKITD